MPELIEIEQLIGIDEEISRLEATRRLNRRVAQSDVFEHPMIDDLIAQKCWEAGPRRTVRRFRPTPVVIFTKPRISGGAVTLEPGHGLIYNPSPHKLRLAYLGITMAAGQMLDASSAEALEGFTSGVIQRLTAEQATDILRERAGTRRSG